MFKENQMNKNAKLFITCLGLGMASYINAAAAASDAILFKIHDIVPVKNADGNVVSCDVGATFYNRTDNEASNVALNLIWADEVVADAINQEERNAREAKRQNRRTSRYNTATYNSRNVTMSLRLPPMKPYQQITLKSKIATDRCFLLLNDMEVDVTNCGTASEGKNVSGRVNTNCSNLFRYISPKNPEYYSEFKQLSPEEQNAQEQSESDKQKQEINTLYKDTINSITALSRKLTTSRPTKETEDKKE